MGLDFWLRGIGQFPLLNKLLLRSKVICLSQIQDKSIMNIFIIFESQIFIGYAEKSTCIFILYPLVASIGYSQFALDDSGFFDFMHDCV